MRTTNKNYEEVAKRCSSFERTTESDFTNVVDSDCTSCLNCTHFTPDEHCTLDLYDSIAENL